MLSSPVLMLSSPVLMLSSPVLMLSSPVLMLSSPNLNLFPYLHQFDKNILGDHHSSKAIWLIQLHLHVPMTSLRGKLCELKVWAEFFFFEGSNSAHNNQQANSHGGELPECSYPSLVCWEAPHNRCATWTVLALTHLRQLRRMFGHCSQHKCSCLLVEPLCVEVRYGYPLSLKYRKHNLVG